MAGDPLAVPVLIGLGITELSVAIPSVPIIKDTVGSLDRGTCQTLAARCPAAVNGAEVRNLLSDL